MDPFVTTQTRAGAAEAVQAPAARGVRPRALVTALVGIAAGVLWDEWTAYYLKGSQLSRSHFPMAFFFPFLTVTVLSRLAERLWPGQGLTRQELLVILGAGLAAISAPYDGVMGHLIGVLAAPFYFASPENGWDLYLHDQIPDWLVPRGAGGAMALYFEGAPGMEAASPGVWGTPLFWWACLLGAVGFAAFCLVVVLRRPWMEHERLTYPLVEVGRMLAETPAGGGWPAFFRSPLFWMGFGLVMGLKMWNVVSYFAPSFPAIPFEGGQFQLFQDFPRWIRRVSFYAVGFGYFAPLDVLLSVWFFVLATAFEVFAFNRLGHNLGSAVVQWQSEALGWQSLGALLFLASWSLWMARRHLREVCRRAFFADDGVDDSRELLSYRTAVFGFLGSLLFAGGWLCAAGMELFVVALFLPVALLTFLGLSRVVAELGLVYAYYQVQPYDAVLQALGSRMMGPSSVVMLAFMRVFNSIEKGFVMPAFTQAVKAVDGVVRPRRVAAVIWLALGVGFAVSLADTLFIGYKYGAYNMGGLMVNGAQRGFGQAVAALRNPTAPGGGGRMMFAGIGFAAMAALTLVRYRAPWWPLHPIGLAVQGSFGVTKSSISVFLVWAIKWVIVQIGGAGLYERGKPFFVGLLAGQALSTAVVFGVDMVWFPGQGHNVHNY